MNDNAEYDLLLKSVFDSCDNSGTGFLSPNEFQDLCTQLCLEEEHSLLKRVLFSTNSTLLSYERFREVLLLLLAGTLTDEVCENEPCNNAIVQQVRIDSVGFSASEEDCATASTEEANGNLVKQAPQHRNYEEISATKCRKSDSAVNGVASSDWPLIDFDGKVQSESNEKNYRPSRLSYSPNYKRRHKRYGRKSLPDEDLLSSNKNTWSNNANFYTPLVHTERLSTDVTMHNRQLELPKTIAEELIGEGDGGHWINPDSSETFLEEDNNNHVNEHDTSSVDPQEALESMWRSIIGHPDEKITVEQLQHFYHIQSLSSSGGDVQQLFDLLDTDGDGLICFADFSRQMSTFVMGNENQVPEVNDNTYNLIDFDENVRENNASSPTSHCDKPSTDTTSFQTFVCPTSQNSALSYTSHVTSNSVLEPQPTTQTVADRVASSRSIELDESFNSSQVQSSRSNTNDGASNSSDDGMRRYHGAPSYRRRRRSSQQHPSRHHNHRKRSTRTLPLPHYHPIRMQNLEDCPLYFLTEESGRYVDVDSLRAIWKDENIDDTDQVIKDLGIDLDDSFSIEVVSEAFENELKDKLVYQAVCAVYKHGIRYYKSQREHEVSERKKTEDMMEHLNSQLHEQEDKIERMEIDYDKRMKESENLLKIELATLNKQLEQSHSKYNTINEEEVERLKETIQEFKEAERKLQKDLIQAETDNRDLLLRYNHVESELRTTRENLESLQSDFTVLCRQVAQCNQVHTRQQEKMEILLQDYKEGTQLVQDHNDELLCQLETMQKRWNSLDKNNPLKTVKFSNSTSALPHCFKPRSTAVVDDKRSLKESDKTLFIPLPSGSRGSTSSNDYKFDSSTPKKSKTGNWNLATNPEVSLRDLEIPGIPVSCDLLSEMKSSTTGVT